MKMKVFVLVFIFCLILVIGVVGARLGYFSEDKIAMTIAGKNITTQEFENQLYNKYALSAAEDMMNKYLIETDATKYNIKVTDEDLEKKIEHVDEIANRDELKFRFTVEQLIAKYIDDATLKKYFEEHQTQMKTGEKFAVINIPASHEQATDVMIKMKTGHSLQDALQLTGIQMQDMTPKWIDANSEEGEKVKPTLNDPQMIMDGDKHSLVIVTEIREGTQLEVTMIGRKY